MKRFEAVVLAIDMTNKALIPCQVMLLGHLLHSLVRLHCLLIRLLCTSLARSATLIRSLARPLTPELMGLRLMSMN